MMITTRVWGIIMFLSLCSIAYVWHSTRTCIAQNIKYDSEAQYVSTNIDDDIIAVAICFNEFDDDVWYEEIDMFDRVKI